MFSRVQILINKIKTIVTLIIESIYIFHNNNSIFLFSLVITLYWLTVFEYLDSKIKKNEE